MAKKLGISLPNDTYVRAAEAAKKAGSSLSGFIALALRRELRRRDMEDHAAMMREADDVQLLRQRAAARNARLREWKARQQ